MVCVDLLLGWVIQKIFFSDNGTNYFGANSYALHKKIDCYFNPLSASRMGGAWKRMIGRSMRVMVGLLSTVKVIGEIG